MTQPLIVASVLLIGTLALWVLPTAVDSYPVFIVVAAMLAVGLIFGFARKAWLFATLTGTYILIADIFWFARTFPHLLWLCIIVLWAGGTWLVGHIGAHQSRIFHQALASFLLIEVFFVLMLWPLNILSKSVIAVSFGLFLWHEFVRNVPNKQRLQESVVPFLLIVTLMTLTGHWSTF